MSETNAQTPQALEFWKPSESANFTATLHYRDLLLAPSRFNSFASFVRKVEKASGVERAAKPESFFRVEENYLRLQLFELSVYWLLKREKLQDQDIAVIRNALELALANPGSPDVASEIHYSFLQATSMLIFTDPILPLEGLQYTVEVLNAISEMLSPDTIVLLYEDILNIQSIRALDHELFNSQLPRTQNHIIQYLVSAMITHGTRAIAPIFVNLVLRANTEPRMATFVTTGSKALLSIRECLIYQALIEFKSSEEGIAIADAVMGYAATLDRDFSLDKYWLEFIKIAYQGSGTQTLIRAVFNNGDQETRLTAINNIEIASRYPAFQAYDYGAVYSRLVSELLIVEVDSQLRTALNKLRGDLDSIDTEEAQRQSEEQMARLQAIRQSRLTDTSS